MVAGVNDLHALPECSGMRRLVGRERGDERSVEVGLGGRVGRCPELAGQVDRRQQRRSHGSHGQRSSRQPPEGDQQRQGEDPREPGDVDTDGHRMNKERDLHQQVESGTASQSRVRAAQSHRDRARGCRQEVDGRERHLADVGEQRQGRGHRHPQKQEDEQCGPRLRPPLSTYRQQRRRGQSEEQPTQRTREAGEDGEATAENCLCGGTSFDQRDQAPQTRGQAHREGDAPVEQVRRCRHEERCRAQPRPGRRLQQA